MNTKEVIKWGILIVVGWFVLQWIMNAIQSFEAPANIGNGSLYGGWPYAAPLVTPSSPVYGWAPFWNYPGYGGNRYGTYYPTGYGPKRRA